jgi:formate-dependent nitrite reductase membrane component NrfD
VNLFVADPHWGVWIVLYFYLGGIAAGAYLLAVLLEWFGNADDAKVARVAHVIAFPLVAVCLLLLVIDLGRPGRFWHMLLKSEVAKLAVAEGFPFSAAGWKWAVRTPLLKPWSPMSAGSWGLSVFAFCAFVSFLGAVRPQWRVSRWLDRRWVRHTMRTVGVLSAFYVASYTGSLLGASNQPVWSDTVWLSPLFLASAVSTGLAAMILLAQRRQAGTPESRHKLESADLWAGGLEFAVFVLFLLSLGAVLEPVLGAVTGNLLVFGTLLIGLAAPVVVRRVYGSRGWSQTAAAACVLVGGLCLRIGAVGVNAELLARGPAANRGISPELTRHVGQSGADPGNHGPEIPARTKLPGEP